MNEVSVIKLLEKNKICYLKNVSSYYMNSDIVVLSDGQVQYLGEILSKNNYNSSELNVDEYTISRKATDKDILKYESNKKYKEGILEIATNVIFRLDLDMKLITTYYSLNRDKLTFLYFSEGRVDFRDLLKELAMIFKTKIELYQVTEREHSKEISGLGPCGKPLCCTNFLTDFHQVSIKMVKEQNLIFNISKVTGVCGKLLCCLKYENDYYKKVASLFPDINSSIIYNDKEYILKDIDPIKELVMLKSTENGDVIAVKIEQFTDGAFTNA